MPGLTGILKKQDNQLNIGQLLSKMCQIIRYEDWYKIDTFLDESIGLGRISLGILNPESQPIFNEDKNLCIMMEGEIYGYKDLKEELILKGHRFLVNNDPEFILHLYEEYEREFKDKLKDLNGIFLFMIYNLKNHELIICNDRYGFRPLYWCNRGNYLLFASEIKAILQDKSFTRVVNLEAMAEFFSFGYILGDKTLIEGIKLFPPASIFSYSNGKIKIKEYWNWNKIKRREILHEDEVVDELGRLWLQAVERRMQGDGRMGLFLSGGLDSRAIASAIYRRHYPIHAVTFGKKGCDDYKIAKKVCEKLGIDHHFVKITGERWFSNLEKVVYLTDGLLNVIHEHSLDAIDMAKKYFDVLLDGFAGDLVVGGSYLSREFIDNKEVNEHFIMVLSQIDAKIPIENASELYSPKILDKVQGISQRAAREEIKQWVKDSKGSDYFLLNNHVRRFTLTGMICTQTKLETLKPFFDNDFIEFVYSLPNELRFNHYIYNKMLLKFFPKTFKDIPWHKTGLPIGSSKITQKMHRYYIGGKSGSNRLLQKIGLPPLFKDNRDYVDYDNWMRNNKQLREYIYNTVLNERALNRGYFNPEFIRGLIDKHMSRKENNAQIIGLLLTFELFNRMFIDEEKL